jgi:hypothetical protein
LGDPRPTVLGTEIAELIDNPEERSARSERGLQFVQGFPSEEGMARRIESLILARVAAVSERPEEALV